MLKNQRISENCKYVQLYTVYNWKSNKKDDWKFETTFSWEIEFLQYKKSAIKSLFRYSIDNNTVAVINYYR